MVYVSVSTSNTLELVNKDHENCSENTDDLVDTVVNNDVSPVHISIRQFRTAFFI
jgi:hypothetical protein